MCDSDLASYKNARQEDLVRMMSKEILNQKTELAELKKLLKSVHQSLKQDAHGGTPFHHSAGHR